MTTVTGLTPGVYRLYTILLRMGFSAESIVFSIVSQFRKVKKNQTEFELVNDEFPSSHNILPNSLITLVR